MAQAQHLASASLRSAHQQAMAEAAMAERPRFEYDWRPYHSHYSREDDPTGSSSATEEPPAAELPADPARGAWLPWPPALVHCKRALLEEVDGPSRIQVRSPQALLPSRTQAGARAPAPALAPAPPEPKQILEALKEIPNLARADLLRAYSSLVRDDRQFRSLLALPMDMRKDWLLMEIGSS